MRAWRKRRQSPREWAEQMGSGQLLEEIRQGGAFPAGQEIFLEGGVRAPLRGLFWPGVGRTERNPAGRGERGELALECLRRIDWEGASAAEGLGWLLGAGACQQAPAGWGIVSPRFGEEELLGALERDVERMTGISVIHRALEMLKALEGTPLVEAFGRSRAAREMAAAALAQESLTGKRMRWRALASLMEAAPSLAEALSRAPEPLRGVAGKMGSGLRKAIRSAEGGESLRGIEAALEAGMRDLSDRERASWALDARGRIEAKIGRSGVVGCEEALALLDRAELAARIPKARGAGRARSV